MLKLYYGRENLDKDKFMFEEIRKSLANIGRPGCAKRIFLLVPDQYTLQAERNAFSYLNTAGFIDLEILSINRLAAKVLNETGGSARVHIDKHGRHMLLSKIVNEEDNNLEVFKGMGQSHSFIDMTNNLISELKQYNTDLSALESIIETLEEDNLLKRKLKDIYRIYEKYDEEISGKYIDTEDFVSLFASNIAKSSLVEDIEFWISGFDSFTPKTIEIIKELTKNSKGVNIVLTSDEDSKDAEIFRLTRDMMERLKSAEYRTTKQKLVEPLVSRSSSLEHLERELFSYPYEVFEGDVGDIIFCRAANFYSEAETAASFICKLVREKGLRYRDMAVICNDMETRAPIIKRVFEEYGISFFLDQKRRVLHNPAIVFIISLLDCITEGWLYEDVFRLMKTGFGPIEEDDYEDLENYAVKYKIYGSRWGKDFKYGKKEYDEEELNRLNQLRKGFYDFISSFNDKFKNAKTVKQKTKVLYDFLHDNVELPGKIDKLVEGLDLEYQYDIALEMQQIWESILGLFEQLIELIGDHKISVKDYAGMLKAGFESIELGLIPTTLDQVVVGTMQRTRVGKIKALLVVGANDGVLPAMPQGDDLLSQDERTLLLNESIEICKNDDMRIMEERLAIYKNLSKPEQYLWIGYSAADLEGKEIRPSIILNKLRRLFPNVELEKDIQNSDDPLKLIERPTSSVKYMTEALRKALDGEGEPEEAWQAAYNWYKEKDDKCLPMLKSGLLFTNRVSRLEKDLVKKLFQRKDKNLSLSPSRLEKFSRCPFAHFVLYGLAPEERRVFEVAGREAGDVYHECLMRFSQRLTVEGMDITDCDSPWMKLNKEECEKLVDGLMEEIAEEYREGMLTSGEKERYRTSRMKEVCRKAAWVLVEHVQEGRIKEVFFEGSFGLGEDKIFPPISVDIGGQHLIIEGKIDRVDVLPDGYIKVMDYKSGTERFDLTEVKGGWRLQLMLYLKAAIQGMQERDIPAKPAGVFYFEIADPLIDATDLNNNVLRYKIENELKKKYKLDGVVINDPAVLESIAGDFTGYSDILQVRKAKDGSYQGTSDSRLLDEEEFEALNSVMDRIINELCSSLASGVIDIHPKKTKYDDACRFCGYKSICNFDLSFDGCSYELVK
jgi:ATP-dependent helicase/nuclease subunit B